MDNLVFTELGETEWFDADEYKKALGRDRSKKHRENNPEKDAAKSKNWRENNPDKSSAATKKWRENHPETLAQWKQEIAELNLSLPFVAVDSEGQSYDGDDVIENGVPYKAHGTYLWCASAAQRTGAVAGETRDYPPQILLDPRTNGDDKRVLDAETILDWLLSLPSKYGEVRRRGKDKPAATFIMFGMSYDVSEILAQTNLKTAYQIFKHKRYDDDEAIIAPSSGKVMPLATFAANGSTYGGCAIPITPIRRNSGYRLPKKTGA